MPIYNCLVNHFSAVLLSIKWTTGTSTTTSGIAVVVVVVAVVAV